MRNGFSKTKSDDLLICRHKQICLGGKINCELQHDDDANNIIQISQESDLMMVVTKTLLTKDFSMISDSIITKEWWLKYID